MNWMFVSVVAFPEKKNLFKQMRKQHMHSPQDGFRLMLLKNGTIALSIYFYRSDLKIKILYDRTI